VTAGQGQHDHGDAKSGDEKGSAEQCAARSSEWPRGVARGFGWLGVQAGSGARRRLLRRAGGSAKATQARVGLGVWEEGLGTTRRRRKHVERGARRWLLWRPRRGSVFTSEQKGGGFYSRLEEVGAFLVR
jgi:hypothetical protein